jgi:hypothetical protein
MPTTAAQTKGFSWSYSALKNFEVCPRRYYHYNVKRDVKEEESENLRFGHAVHSAFEARVKHGTPLPMGMGMHEGILAKLASAPGDIYAEQKLAMDEHFQPASWFGKGAWLRTVLDYTNVRPDTGTATVLDYKTGRPSEDLTQLQLCAAMVFTHVPTVHRVKAGLVFVAYGQVERGEFVRDDLAEIWADILPRVRKLVEAKAQDNYPPKPSGLCRRYCAVISCPYNGK